MSPSSLTSQYTGLFSRWGAVPLRPHDPAVPCWAGVLPRWGADGGDLAVGGAAWTVEGAEAAALGEAVERWQARPLPADHIVEASCADWPLDEAAVEPGRWVLFSTGQYASPGFPFAPLSERTVCRWVACREAGTGRACWAPASFVFQSGEPTPFCPTISTGLSAGREGDPVLLHGLQEVIERDALVGAWWSRYPLEEHDPDRVFSTLPADVPPRLLRPNLRYRFYRIATPYSAHVTVVSVAGEDHEGFCFSAGSACRATRPESWLKSILEAVQGRHHVRHLRRTPLAAALQGKLPVDFAGHALYYSLHPERLRETPLERARATGAADDSTEDGPLLRERLGAGRPVLFRVLTPPGVAGAEWPGAARAGWLVLRVLVPGLQPLHGHHGLPFLGGPLWAPRRLIDWQAIPPHPFP
jgi:ribosomal protein S12 methylthiotransferase accessory factor